MTRLATAILSILFGLSAYAKARNPDGAKPLLESVHVPAHLSSFPVRVSMTLEALAAVGLLVPRCRHFAARLSSMLLVTFTGILVVGFVSGYRGNCACFGSRIEQRVTAITFARNVVLIFISLFLSWTGKESAHILEK